jgi:hypothetical protein
MEHIHSKSQNHALVALKLVPNVQIVHIALLAFQEKLILIQLFIIV